MAVRHPSRVLRDATVGLRPGRSGVVLAYHDIISDTAEVYPYAVTESTFLHQLDLVEAAGLRPVTLSHFTDRLAAGDASGLAAIVFDDALLGVHQHALPRLAERGLPWTLLPVTERTGVCPQWWPEASRTMNRTEIDDALSAGATLCAHTTTHASLPGMSTADALDDLRRSRDTLSDWAGTDIRELCYPFGHQNARIRAVASDAGYRVGFTFTNGRGDPRTDMYAQPRLAMHENLRSAKWLATLLRPGRSWPPVRDLGVDDPGDAS